MKVTWIVLGGLAIAWGLFPSTQALAGRPATATVAEGMDSHDHDWDAPPAEFREAEREGFHDGIEAARKDYDNHRAPNVESRGEYRHPHVARDLRDDYREGFRAGYDRATSHLNSLHY